MSVKLKLALLLATGTAGSAAFAAPSDPASTTPVANSSGDQGETSSFDDRDASAEILVTGQRAQFDALGSQKIVDTPFTLTAVNAALIADVQARALNDIVQFSPTAYVSRSDSAQGSDFSVRGNVAELRLFDGASTIGQYVELYDPPLEFYENVQILEGVSGLYFGLSQPGGAVNYISKRPKATSYYSFTFGYQSDSVISGSADFSRRSSDDRFGYRLNLIGAYGTLTAGGVGVRRYGAALNLDFQATDSTKLELDTHYFNRGLLYNNFTIFPQNADGAPPPPIDATRRIGGDGTAAYYRAFGTTLRLKQALSESFSLKLEGSYNRVDTDLRETAIGAYRDDAAELGPVAGTYYGDVFFYQNRRLDKVFNVQALINGDFETGPVRHKIALGGLLNRNKQFYGQLGNGEYDSFDYVGTFLLADLPTISRPDIAPGRANFDNKLLVNNFKTESLFFTDTILIGNHVQIIGGGRYNWVDIDSPGAGGSRYVGKKFVPVGALLLKPNDNSTFYGSYSEGFSAGYIAPTAAANSNEVFPPVVTKQYEVGYKLDRKKLRASAAVFSSSTVGGSVYLIGNLANPLETFYLQGGTLTTQGVEASIDAVLTSELTLTLAGTYYTQQTKGLPEADASSARTDNIVAKARVVYSPNWLPGVTAEGAIIGVNRSFLNALNSIRLPGYATADFGLNYRLNIMSHDLVLRTRLTNIFNRRYYYRGTLNPGDPRGGRVSVTYEF